MNSQYVKKLGLPDKPGVYFFLGSSKPKSEGDIKGNSILYIGKATSLRDRVKSYFSKDLIVTRGPIILDMTVKADDIKWQVTDSVLEALILEANLIKKFKPKYNTKEKDNKSFNYVCITKEELPKVLIIRGRGLDKKIYKKVFGPFPNGLQLREAMKIIRKIFPYIDNDSNKKNNIEFYKQLGLIPPIGTTSQKSYFHQALGSPTQYFKKEWAQPDHSKNNFSASLLEYKKNIKNLKLFFEGKKKKIVSDFKKEMISFAKKKEFEKAGEIKKKIFALEHINDVALIKEEASYEKSFHQVLGSPTQYFKKEWAQPDHSENNFRIPSYRIEAYDIAHMAGRNMVGVMTVIENGELAKSEYKKFIIRTQIGSNDTGALEEVLSRRFRHTEWGLPSLIVMDGSVAQINIAKAVLNRYQFKIPVVSVVKDDRHKAKAIMGDEVIIKRYKKEILLINNESHRFAITFHKKRRDKNFLL